MAMHWPPRTAPPKNLFTLGFVMSPCTGSIKISKNLVLTPLLAALRPTRATPQKVSAKKVPFSSKGDGGIPA